MTSGRMTALMVPDPEAKRLLEEDEEARKDATHKENRAGLDHQ